VSGMSSLPHAVHVVESVSGIGTSRGTPHRRMDGDASSVRYVTVVPAPVRQPDTLLLDTDIFTLTRYPRR
jgi:hypothetical protein